MIGWVVVALGAVVVVARLGLRRRRAAARSADRGSGSAGGRSRPGPGPRTGDIGLVAAREVRERYRGRVFRVGTLIILAVVAGAIVIPKLDHSTPAPQRVGVVGPLSTQQRSAVAGAGKGVGTAVRFEAEADRQAADAALRSGAIDLAIVDGRQLVVDRAITPTDTTTTAQFARAVAKEFGVARAVAAAGLSPAQYAALAGAKPLPVGSLQPGRAKRPTNATVLIGVILIFLMLNQYNTWILVGVMEEKSSRVIEVLLAAVRPIRLLTGKVLGIGLVAFSQAALVLAFALVLGEAIGSPILHGTAPLVLASILVWLVLGYAFYCWVYAAAGSMVERQEQVQSLALPLSLPIIFGYIMALTAAASGNTSTLVKVLAYLPPTAPFCMPVLVGYGLVSWWGFAASAALTVVCTFGMARLAAGIYRRAVLHTGRRVRLREVVGGAG